MNVCFYDKDCQAINKLNGKAFILKISIKIPYKCNNKIK